MKNAPSTTGKQSGGGRSNAPSKSGGSSKGSSSGSKEGSKKQQFQKISFPQNIKIPQFPNPNGFCLLRFGNWGNLCFNSKA